MKRFCSLALAIATVGVGLQAQTPTKPQTPAISGKWNVHSSVAGTDSDSVCTFEQKDKALSGSCSTPDQGDKKLTGSVDDTKVSWSFDTEYNGTALTVKFVGTLDPKAMKISGTTSVEQVGVDGDFTAVPAK